MIDEVICNDLGDETKTKVPIIPNIGDLIQWITDISADTEIGFTLSKVTTITHVLADNGEFSYIEIYVEDM